MSEFGLADKVMCPDDDSNAVTDNDDEGKNKDDPVKLPHLESLREAIACL